MNEILPNAVDFALNVEGINLKDYDKNSDGYIDAVWLVYDHLDWTLEYEEELVKFIDNINHSGIKVGDKMLYSNSVYK